jgi:hypothetical protein
MSHQLLDSNRTNARSTPNKPTTWSGVADAVAGGNVTIDGTSGIKAKSRIELSLTSGGAVVLETPWKYGGFLDPWLANDFTFPVVTHQVVIPETNLQPGKQYFYKWHGVDPVGRDFWSAEGDFTVTAAPAPDFPAVGNVRDTDTVDGVTGTLPSNKILKSNVTGSGAGNYDDDNLGVGNVRPVLYGVGATGDLTGLLAADAAYVALENSRNNDNGTVAADILTGESVKIRNTTINGAATAESHTANQVVKSAGGNYDDDNLAVGNVRPVLFGLGLTGTLANLAAGDAAYVALEATRNSFTTLPAGPLILVGETLTLAGVPTAGTFDEAARNIGTAAGNIVEGASITIATAVTNGTYHETAEGEVKNGVGFGAGSAQTGNVTLPAVGKVELAQTYGTLGTEFTGTVTTPSINDVRLATTFGPALSLTGNVTIPAEANVKKGTTYGSALGQTGTLRTAASMITVNA